MSSSIAIPTRRKQHGGGGVGAPAQAAAASSNCSHSSSSSFSYGSFGAPSPASAPEGEGRWERRPSLMSPAFAKTEHTVINVGNSEAPRLITCVKASQGFDWNQEIFLPSYADYPFQDLERKQDPVQDIVVTDEEIRNMFPS
ncbi:hypothetical protein K505DRAFT_323228 [Melanomma pulvis-pyrius CBS 109.77]|uniref:Uncharacterized protein n=1 Tax=Melanomma pulvis-pyrius CBS 109.77 TaxID=1314802 RepID=A0A6A6XLY6_9PLEO|nr:hypothetical protein K505DRAFT_323228 [Melanomma pulvis-pyrius CBS 109.77]